MEENETSIPSETEAGRWSVDPERIDPDDYPPGRVFVKVMTWAPCDDCRMQVHAPVSQFLLRGITCPRCDYVGRPDLKKEMAENAMLFIILGIFFLPLLILGVLMKETWEVCPECRKKLRKVGGTTFGG